MCCSITISVSNLLSLQLCLDNPSIEAHCYHSACVFSLPLSYYGVALPSLIITGRAVHIEVHIESVATAVLVFSCYLYLTGIR